MRKKIRKFLDEHEEGIVTGIIGAFGMILAYFWGKSERLVHTILIFVSSSDKKSEEEETED